MGDGAHRPSLNVQSGPQPGELSRLVAELAERVAAIEAEKEARQYRIRELLGTSADPRIPPPRARPPSHRRKRHLRMIPGGLAAAVPLVLLLGGPGARVAAMGVCRWVWKAKTDHIRWAAAAVLLAFAGAVFAPATPQVSARPPPRAHAAVHRRHHRNLDGDVARAPGATMAGHARGGIMGS